MTRLQGTVAVVTGGAGGIGRAVVRAFVGQGASVVAVDRDEAAGAELVRELGDRVRFVGGDVADRSLADRAVAQAVADFGSLSVVVTCAQASRQAPFLDQTIDDFDLALRSGLHSTVHFLQAAHPHLAAAGGSFVAFASGAGVEGMPTQASYAAAKEAVRGLVRVVANEWARDGIRVNVVCPVAETEGVRRWADEFPEDYRRSAARNPMGRWGDPELDVAPVVVFLASDDSRYMTGQTLMADGGAVKVR